MGLAVLSHHCRGMVDLVLKRGPCADYPWSYCLMYSVTHETLLRLHRKGRCQPWWQNPISSPDHRNSTHDKP